MSQTMSVQQAAANLPKLVDSLAAGDEIVLTDNERPVAKIVPARQSMVPRKPGSARGMLTVISEDDDHLADFEGHVP